MIPEFPQGDFRHGSNQVFQPLVFLRPYLHVLDPIQRHIDGSGLPLDLEGQPMRDMAAVLSRQFDERSFDERADVGDLPQDRLPARHEPVLSDFYGFHN